MNGQEVRMVRDRTSDMWYVQDSDDTWGSLRMKRDMIRYDKMNINKTDNR